MNTIFINGRFLTRRVTGVERYARELVKELDKIASGKEIYMVVPNGDFDIPDYENIKVIRKGNSTKQFWENFIFPAFVRSKKGISLNLCNVAPIFSPGIVCIHDMKVKAAPEYFNKKFLVWYNFLFKNQTKRAKKIITVSNFSKDEICKYYHVKPEKISVIYNAWQHFEAIDSDDDTLERYNLEAKNYYFSMSSLEPNKNFKWIANAAVRNPGRTFVVAGSINEKVFSMGTGFDKPDNVKLLGYITDEEAKTLMKECKAFLFPTFYEGFGIPPVEAVYAGAETIVVSDTRVMHELFDDHAVYVDPEDYENNAWMNMTGSGDIKEVLDKFSWEESAKKLLTVLEDV